MSSNTGTFTALTSSSADHGEYADLFRTACSAGQPSLWSLGDHTPAIFTTPLEFDLILNLDASCAHRTWNALQHGLAPWHQFAFAREFTYFSPFEHLYAEQAESALKPFRSLEDDWDGYGALKIREDTIEHAQKALTMLLGLAPMPDISPNPNGTISFEWEDGEILAHLEMGSTMYSGFIRMPGADSKYFKGDAANVPEEFGRIVGAAVHPDDLEFTFGSLGDVHSPRLADTAITRIEIDGGHVSLAA